MIDNLSILFSTLACAFVIYRAVKLDRKKPWFGEDPRQAEPAPPDFPELW